MARNYPENFPAAHDLIDRILSQYLVPKKILIPS